MRHWHYLHTDRDTGWPQTSVALSVVCSAGAVKGDYQQTRSTSLLGWAASAWSGEQGRAEQTANADGISAESFWRWLCGKIRKGTRLWVWQVGACHGLASLGFWEMLTAKDWSLCGRGGRDDRRNESECNGRGNGCCIVTDPPTLLMARPSFCGGSVCFTDLRNLGRIGYEDIISDVGMSGESSSPSGWAFRTGREIARIRAKALALWLQSWYQTVRELKLGGLRGTAASQAWHGWKTSYLKTRIEVHCDEQRLGAERTAIYGGRNEAFRVGQALSNVCEVDARGFYPSIASSNAMPGRIARMPGLDRFSPAELNRSGFLVIARGILSTATACLPYRCDGITVYPIGRWGATYCWPEWELLGREGGKYHIEQWWAYEPTEPFQEYYEALYRARLAARSRGERAQESALKLLMNALVGRCATTGKCWVDCPDEFHPNPWDSWDTFDHDSQRRVRWRSLGWNVQREEESGEHADSVPALAAWIYSLGRVQLREWMRAAGLENVYYVDTDSLWTNEAGHDRITRYTEMDSGELGGLRLIRRHEWARFFGHKHYETPRGLVCAGLPKEAMVLSEDRRTRWLADSPGAAARRGRAPTTALARQEIVDRQPYRGGKVGVDGIVYPLEVE